MTHTHTSRRWAMGTVALAASAANPEVEDYESERRSQLRKTRAADRRSPRFALLGRGPDPDGRLQ